MTKKSILTVLLPMVFTAAAMAQTHDSLKENLEQHVRILASDDMRGRLAGSADAAAAAAYISSQFEEIGISRERTTTAPSRTSSVSSYTGTAMPMLSASFRAATPNCATNT